MFVTGILLCQFVAMLGNARARGDVAVDTIAWSSEFVPGSDRIRFSHFYPPQINDSGEVAFVAEVSGITGPWLDRQGVFQWNGTSLLSLAVNGDPIDGGRVPGETLEIRSIFPRINNQGDVLFSGWIRDQGQPRNRTATLVADGSRQNRVLFQNGDALVNYPGDFTLRTIEEFGETAFNNHGQLRFLINLQGAITSEMLGTTSGLGTTGQPVALRAEISGQTGVDELPGYALRGISSNFVLLNDQGTSVFAAYLREGPRENLAILRSRSDGLDLLLTDGDPVPNAVAGTTFANMQVVGMNNSDEFLLSATYTNPSITLNGKESGLWLWSDESMYSVAQQGDVVEDENGGAAFLQRVSPDSPFHRFVLSGTGAVAFVADVAAQGADVRSSLLLDQGDGLLTVVSEGGTAPGLPGGATFRDLLSPDTLVAVNSQGQVAFLADTTVGRGIWIRDVDGTLVPVAIAGEEFQVTDGDVRTVSYLSVFGNSGGEDGRPQYLNDRGQVAFNAEFTDGTVGVFVSRAFVPEPLSGVTPFFLIVGCLWHRLRRSS